MAQAAGQRKGQRTAEEAFLDYVSLDRKERSLRLLAETYVARGYYKNPGTALAVLNRWSSQHHWQDRIRKAASEAAERKIQEAADLDADTFLRTSQLLNDRIKYTDSGHIDMVVKMRESVRKPAPKGGTSVNVDVNIDVQIRERVEEYARKMGLDVEEALREADRIIADSV